MTDKRINRKEENNFKNNKAYYEASRNKKKLLNLYVYVAKKITEEGWKVGYMFKNEPAHVYQLDFDISKYIDNPVGTQMIRISLNEFEVDDHKKGIYIEKR